MSLVAQWSEDDHHKLNKPKTLSNSPINQAHI